IYGVMRIVNLAHGMLYAFGAYVSAWAVGVMVTRWPVGLLFVLLPLGAVAAAGLGAVLEPTLLRPFYRRAEGDQLLLTFRLLLILADLLRPLWGADPPSSSPPYQALGRPPLRHPNYPHYNLLVIPGGGPPALRQSGLLSK